MAVFNEPTQWDHTLGNNADTSTLPDDAAATAGIASRQKLFQIINATPLEAGGIAPAREDVNALFKYLGDQIFYTQNGGIPSYNAAYDYIPGRVVLYTDNNIYKCIQANGVSSTVVTPDSDTAYWQQLDGENTSTSLIPNQIITSPVPLTDANLHLLDGALLSDLGAYSTYVAMMGELYNADPTATCWTTESDWQTSLTTYGECGKFVYDSVNNTLRLPKLTSFVQATNSANELGSLVEAGLPNITGDVGGVRNDSSSIHPSGAFNVVSSAGNFDSGGGQLSNVDFSASRSSSIYGNSTTVQPQAIKYYFYIVVGTISKTDIQIDIDNAMADLALKADKDLSNATPTSAFATAMNSANIRTVVETYVNGDSGYRVYSDGFCIQWGTNTNNTSNVSISIALIKKYANTNYGVLMSRMEQSSNGATNSQFSANSKTVSGFYMQSGLNGSGVANSSTVLWFTFGYIS